MRDQGPWVTCDLGMEWPHQWVISRDPPGSPGLREVKTDGCGSPNLGVSRAALGKWEGVIAAWEKDRHSPMDLEGSCPSKEPRCGSGLSLGG